MPEHPPPKTNPPPPGSSGDKEVVHRAGVRQALTDKVTLFADDGSVFVGRALDVSRGGVRVLLADPLEIGDEFEVVLGQIQGAIPYRGRAVWARAGEGGVEVGVEFLATSGTHKSAPPTGGYEPI